MMQSIQARHLWELPRQEITGLHWRLMAARLLVAPLPIYVGSRLRSLVLRIAGFRVGRGTLIAGMPTISGPKGLHRNLVIGRHCFVNVGCLLDLGAALVVGDRVSLGQEVMLLTTTHEPGPLQHRAGPIRSSPVSVGDGAWLGARCVVLPGVRIGEGAIVAAGAVVTRDVESHTLVAGVPARFVRSLAGGESTAAPTGTP
jgi:maltose O-acetyltransferase